MRSAIRQLAVLPVNVAEHVVSSLCCVRVLCNVWGLFSVVDSWGISSWSCMVVQISLLYDPKCRRWGWWFECWFPFHTFLFIISRQKLSVLFVYISNRSMMIQMTSRTRCGRVILSCLVWRRMRHLSEERTFDVTHFLVLWYYSFLKVFHTLCALCLKWVGKFFFWSMRVCLQHRVEFRQFGVRLYGTFFLLCTLDDGSGYCTFCYVSTQTIWRPHLGSWHVFSIVWSSDLPHQNTSLRLHVSCYTVFLWDIEVLAELGNSIVEGFWFECFRFAYMEKYFVRLRLGFACWIFFSIRSRGCVMTDLAMSVFSFNLFFYTFRHLFSSIVVGCWVPCRV